MTKIPLSASTTLTNLSPISTLSVSPYGNETGKTGEAAPVLIAVESKKTIFADEFAALLPAKGGQGTEQQARLIVNAVATVLEDLVSEYGAFTANTPLGTIETFIAGSLANATDPVNPDENVPFLGVIVPAELMKQFRNIEAYVPASVCPAALKRVCDVATGVRAICGTKAFHIQGYGLTYGGTGEQVNLLNPITRATICAVTIDTTTKSESQLNGTLPGTTAIPAGTYILQVITLAGGGSAGGVLWPLELKVTLAESVVVPPELTKIKEGTRPDNTVGFTESKVTITGTNIGGFKTGDQLRLEGVPSGAAYLASMSLNSFVTASDETSITLGQGFENLSEKPDTDWDNKQAVVTLVRDGASYPLTFNFQNA